VIAFVAVVPVTHRIGAVDVFSVVGERVVVYATAICMVNGDALVVIFYVIFYDDAVGAVFQIQTIVSVIFYVASTDRAMFVVPQIHAVLRVAQVIVQKEAIGRMVRCYSEV